MIELVLPEGWQVRCSCPTCQARGTVPIITLEGFLCAEHARTEEVQEEEG